MARSSIWGLFILLVTVFSCNSNVLFEEHIVFDYGWHKDSAAVFDVALNDTTLVMDFILTFKHTDNYPYSNLWLFNSIYDFNNTNLQTDTIDLFIASPTGQWFGKKQGGVYNVSTYYRNNVKMAATGNYKFSFRQGMRVNNLEDIKEVTFKIINAQ